jgi:ERCC4-related helicase
MENLYENLKKLLILSNNDPLVAERYLKTFTNLTEEEYQALSSELKKIRRIKPYRKA